MRILHVGPPLTRTGGPAGYLLELSRASERAPSARHDLRFPPPALPRPPRTGTSRTRRTLRRWKRRLLGAPRFYRPPSGEIGREGGVLAELIGRAADESAASCQKSFEPLENESVDVLFVHDPFAIQEASTLRGSAELWLMIHSPMPMGLYLAWNWGCPEAAWEELAALPDVRAAIEVEIDAWRRVDRVILPCEEALEELARVDARFADIDVPLEFLLSGSSAVGAPRVTKPRGEAPVALFLGSGQAYRGLDVLVDAVRLLPPLRELPGVVALAGPSEDAVPDHPRLRALGRIEDVPRLLASVDFLVNTNRFSLFDLSNIEAAAAGKALLLHAVGGNKALARLGAGCRLFEPLTPRALADALAEMFSVPGETNVTLGLKSRVCYEAHLTADLMWRRHLDLYDRAEARVREKRVVRA